MSKTNVSIDSLNLAKQCDEAFEFEYIEPSGKGSGIYLSVVGNQSERVRKFNAKEVNKMRRQQVMNQKKGNKDDFTPIEDDIEFMIENAAVRIVAWRGIEQECTPENAKLLCEINSEIRKQVIDESDKLENFTKRK